MKIFTQIALLTVLLIPAIYSQGADSGSTEPQAAFDRLLALEGTWMPNDSKGDFRIIFEAISGNTVLLETWMAGASKHSITVYHLDNDRVIATHYCPQGNQPRLELDLDGSSDKFDFTHFDATGIDNSNDSYQHNLSFDFRGPDESLVRSETYITGGVEETDSLILVRDGATLAMEPPQENNMEKVLGIGGLFFRSEDPGELARWYETHLGISLVPTSYEQEPWQQDAGPTVFAPFGQDTTYFGNPDQTWMINFRVADLEAMMDQLRGAGLAPMVGKALL